MDTLRLVPIEPDSEQHTAELERQRVLCGWGVENVALWRRMMRDGDKCMYWIFPLDPAGYAIPAEERLSEDYHDPPNMLLCSKESGNVMVSTFFILESLQGRGLGNAAMDLIEREAAVLGARAITLNTWQAKDWTDEQFCARIGVPWKPEARQNECWYRSRGYEVFQEDIPRFPFKLPDGSITILNSVSMKKQLG